MADMYQALSDEKVKEIAFDHFKQIEGKTQPQTMPRLALVGGQPGAGKSQASDLVKDELLKQGGYVRIDADRMRELIPLGSSKPTSEQTQRDAGRLVAALRELAVSNRRNIIEEGTYRNSQDARKFILGKKAQGYQVELLAVATPPEQSLLGIYNRFEVQHKIGADNPRMVPEQYHDDASRGFEATLSKASAHLDRTRVIDRSGNVLYDSRTTPAKDLMQAFEQGRKLTDVKLKETLEGWARTREMAAQRQAQPDYQKMLEKHHERIKAMQKNRNLPLCREEYMALAKTFIGKIDDMEKRAAVMKAIGERLDQRGVSAMVSNKSATQPEKSKKDKGTGMER